MNYLIKKFKREEGFGLIEVLVGMVMLLFTATAALTLSNQVTRSETFNEKRMVAYNLAQWAMEDIRKNRDSMWDDIQADDSRWEDEGFWSTEMYKDLSDPNSGYECSSGTSENGYEVYEDCVVKDDNSNTVDEKYTLKVKISKIAKDDDDKVLTDLHEQKSENKRTNDIDNSMAKRVEVVVEWNERGTDIKNLKLVSMLTDWNYLHMPEVK